jgi:hypothetical protein
MGPWGEYGVVICRQRTTQEPDNPIGFGYVLGLAVTSLVAAAFFLCVFDTQNISKRLSHIQRRFLLQVVRVCIWGISLSRPFKQFNKLDASINHL